MSMRGAFVAALLIAFAIAAPANPVAAQTQDGVMKSKTAAEKKADGDARKAAKDAAKAEKKARRSSDRSAAKARRKECGAEWKAARAAGKVEQYMTWPRYYSACDKRLKEKAA